MKLSGEQRKKLQEALIDAFPSKNLLEQMLSFEFDKNLNEISEGDNLAVIVFELIKKAEAQNWIEELINAAHRQNPGNELLKEFALKKERINQIENEIAEIERQKIKEERIEQPTPDSNKEQLVEITLIRENRGYDRSWILKIENTENKNNKIIHSTQREWIRKGETITFKLIAKKYYKMQLSYEERTTVYLSRNPATYEESGRSNQWYGVLAPGKYIFECGVEPGIQLKNWLLSVVTLFLLNQSRLYLKEISFEEW